MKPWGVVPIQMHMKEKADLLLFARLDLLFSTSSIHFQTFLSLSFLIFSRAFLDVQSSPTPNFNLYTMVNMKGRESSHQLSLFFQASVAPALVRIL